MTSYTGTNLIFFAILPLSIEIAALDLQDQNDFSFAERRISFGPLPNGLPLVLSEPIYFVGGHDFELQC